MKNIHLVIPIGLLAVAVLFRFWIAPQATRLPTDYNNTFRYLVEDRYRSTPDGEWQATQINAWRVDQTLVNTQVAIVEADLHWNSVDGDVIFESNGLYGVNHATLQNDPEFGDARRTGQFLFPAHIQPKTFTLWDPMFIAPRKAVFDHIESMDGMLVYVFRFSVGGMDETKGYASLPGVPDRYRVLTDGQGSLWIEPLSGVLVDYREQGASYFVDAIYLERVAKFHEWTSKYASETRSAQLGQARNSRWRLMLLETILPVGFSLSAILLFAAGLYRAWISQRAKR